MSRIDSRHWKISTGHHFQNGRHNTAQIQHCPISTTLYMWVDYDVLNRFPTSKNVFRSPFSKWPATVPHKFSIVRFQRHFHMWVDYDVRIYSRHWKISSGRHFRTNSTLSDFNHISYMGRLWCLDFIPYIEKFLVVAIFKMAAKIQHCPMSLKFDMWVDNDVPNWFPTLKNFYRSPFSKWLPQYRTNSTLFDFNKISYVGRLWWPELIPDIEKFLLVSIFKMTTTIPQKFNIVRFQRYL